MAETKDKETDEIVVTQTNNEETLKGSEESTETQIPSGIVEMLKEFSKNSKPQVQILPTTKKVKDAVDENNRRYFWEAIRDEVKDNEEKKREHKDTLLTAVKWFLGIQFGLFFILLAGVVTMCFIAHLVGNPFPMNLVEVIFDMIGKYLLSIVAELIAILFFIVTNVFDTTIPDLAKQFVNDRSGNDDKGNNSK